MRLNAPGEHRAISYSKDSLFRFRRSNEPSQKRRNIAWFRSACRAPKVARCIAYTFRHLHESPTCNNKRGCRQNRLFKCAGRPLHKCIKAVAPFASVISNSASINYAKHYSWKCSVLPEKDWNNCISAVCLLLFSRPHWSGTNQENLSNFNN